MFGAGHYATIKKVEPILDDKGNNVSGYTCKLVSASKKNGETTTDFVDGHVKFFYKAFEKHPVANQRIKITSAGVQNCYVTQNGELKFFKAPHFTVFDYELVESKKTEKDESLQENMFSGDDYMPF